MSQIEGRTLWDCGCTTWKEETRFFIKPCLKPDCKVYPVTLEESKLRGNSVEVWEGS